MRRQGFIFGVAALICATTFFYSCKNDDERLGIPNGNNPNVIVIDTFSVFTRTVPEDSFATHRLTLNILGALNSTTFGKSTAAPVMNFALPNVTNFSFPAGSKIDSIFLVLQYGGTSLFNGDINTSLKINALELTKNIYLDSIYYSNTVFPSNPTPIGSYTGTFNLFDSVSVSFRGTTTKQAPQLRLRLNNATFGNKLVNGTVANFATNTAFKDFIKGIRLSVDNSSLGADAGVAAYLSLFTGLSGLHVYYNDTSSAVFPIDEGAAVASTYTHDFTGTPIASQFNNPADYATCYLQSMAGTRILVEIPGLQNFALNDDYAIVGANLEFSPDAVGSGSGFANPTRLLLLARDSNNQSTLVVDAINEPDIYNGNYNSAENKYEFNFPRHVQLLHSELKKKGQDLNKGFFIRIPADRPITATRLTVNTQKNVARGIRFKLHVIKVR